MSKTCTRCHKEFSYEDADRIFFDRFDIPEPDTCATCNVMHLLSFWILGNFRKGSCALSGKTIITVRPESVPFPLYDREEWMSDKWDPMEYAQDYDPSKPFFDQMWELWKRVPRPHQSGTHNVNSPWNDDVWHSKDSYMCRSMLECENISYGYRTYRSKFSIDIAYSFQLDQCYDCLYCFNSFQLRHAFDSRECVQSAFLYDCRNCQDCFMCWNLRNKQYCIRNIQYTKEEYFEKIKEYNLGNWHELEKLKTEFKQLVADEAIHKQHFATKTNNSTGNFLDECNNVHHAFYVEKSENSRHIFRGFYKDSILSTGGVNEKSIRGMILLNCYEVMSVMLSENCRYSYYLDSCEECEYCFGCVGLRKKKYCIFNKQYDKQEYQRIIGLIKESMKQEGTWGEFFPKSFAYGSYNESFAQLHFPLTKEAALAWGAKWEDEDEVSHEGLYGDDIPADIRDVPDDFPNQALLGLATKRRYNIAAHELEFYRQHNIPIPREHSFQRTLDRFIPMKNVMPYQGTDYFTGEPITHYYPPEFKYKKIVSIEEYQKRVS